jgi:hypothetical protein
LRGWQHSDFFNSTQQSNEFQEKTRRESLAAVKNNQQDLKNKNKMKWGQFNAEKQKSIPIKQD